MAKVSKSILLLEDLCIEARCFGVSVNDCPTIQQDKEDRFDKAKVRMVRRIKWLEKQLEEAKSKESSMVRTGIDGSEY